MKYAAMAQLVERVLGKDEVTGSNPVSSSRRTPKGVLFRCNKKREKQFRPFDSTLLCRGNATLMRSIIDN